MKDLENNTVVFTEDSKCFPIGKIKKLEKQEKDREQKKISDLSIG